jgi:hypothetical protein
MGLSLRMWLHIHQPYAPALHKSEFLLFEFMDRHAVDLPPFSGLISHQTSQ